MPFDVEREEKRILFVDRVKELWILSAKIGPR
jgi:hypothetical protein